MSSVISYRTDRIEQLKQMAKEKNISLSTLTSEIISKFLDQYLLITHYDMYRGSKPALSFCFACLDTKQLGEAIEIGVQGAINSIKAMISDYHFENILGLVRTWFNFNEFALREFDDKNQIKLVCQNSMSKNWNTYAATVLVRIFEHFGYHGTVDSTEKNFLSFRIDKQKNP